MTRRDGSVHRVRFFSRAGPIVALLSGVLFAQPSTISTPPADPVELVRQAVANEVRASKEDGNRFMFRSLKTTGKGSVTKIYIETRQATAGMVVAYDGKPLTPEQRKAELDRIERFLKNPEE